MPSGKAIVQKLNYNKIFTVDSGAGRWEVSIKKLIQPTGYRVYQPDVSYTVLIKKFTSPKLVTEPTDLVSSTWVVSRVEGQEVSTNSLQQVAPTIYRDY